VRLTCDDKYRSIAAGYIAFDNDALFVVGRILLSCAVQMGLRLRVDIGNMILYFQLFSAPAA
jgi:hypothetical protein